LWNNAVAAAPEGIEKHEITLRPYEFSDSVPVYRDLIRWALHNSGTDRVPSSIEIAKLSFDNGILGNYSPKIRIFRRPVHPFLLTQIPLEPVNAVAFNGFNEFPDGRVPADVRVGNRVVALNIPEIHETLEEFGKLSLRGDEVLPPVQLTRFSNCSIIKGCKVTVSGRNFCAMIEVYHCTPDRDGPDCITEMIPRVRTSPNQSNDPMLVNLPVIPDAPPSASGIANLHVYFISILLNEITKEQGLVPVSVRVGFIEPPTRYTFPDPNAPGDVDLSPQQATFAYIRELEL